MERSGAGFAKDRNTELAGVAGVANDGPRLDRGSRGRQHPRFILVVGKTDQFGKNCREGIGQRSLGTSRDFGEGIYRVSFRAHRPKA